MFLIPIEDSINYYSLKMFQVFSSQIKRIILDFILNNILNEL